MNKKLIVTLLRKSIQELEMITEGFMEMDHYPTPHIQLAQRKTEDIQTYIHLLSTVMPELTVDTEQTTENIEIPIVDDIVKENQIDESEKLANQLNQPAIIDQSEFEITENNVETTKIQDLSSTEYTTEITTEFTKEDKEDNITNSKEVNLIDEVETNDQVDNKDIEIITETSEVLEAEFTTTTFEDNNEEIIEEIFTSNETKTFFEETKKSVIADKNATTTITRNELLSKTENTISSTLANKKITDIRQAINIGDRFRFQRELFRGNGEDMNKTISYVNQLATLNEALSFLKSKYGWATDNDTAEDFYQIVRRRFV